MLGYHSGISHLQLAYYAEILWLTALITIEPFGAKKYLTASLVKMRKTHLKLYS
jgi:hypothetical protein